MFKVLVVARAVTPQQLLTRMDANMSVIFPVVVVWVFPILMMGQTGHLKLFTVRVARIKTTYGLITTFQAHMKVTCTMYGQALVVLDLTISFFQDQQIMATHGHQQLT